MSSKFSFYALSIQLLLLLKFRTLLFLLDDYILLCWLNLLFFLLFVVDVGSFYSLDTSCKAEIANLDGAVLIQKNIGLIMIIVCTWFEVSVEYFSTVQIFKSDYDVVYDGLDVEELQMDRGLE